jgi:hypothetical protein
VVEYYQHRLGRTHRTSTSPVHSLFVFPCLTCFVSGIMTSFDLWLCRRAADGVCPLPLTTAQICQTLARSPLHTPPPLRPPQHRRPLHKQLTPKQVNPQPTRHSRLQPPLWLCPTASSSQKPHRSLHRLCHCPALRAKTLHHTHHITPLHSSRRQRQRRWSRRSTAVLWRCSVWWTQCRPPPLRRWCAGDARARDRKPVRALPPPPPLPLPLPAHRPPIAL